MNSLLPTFTAKRHLFHSWIGCALLYGRRLKVVGAQSDSGRVVTPKVRFQNRPRVRLLITVDNSALPLFRCWKCCTRHNDPLCGMLRATPDKIRMAGLGRTCLFRLNGERQLCPHCRHPVTKYFAQRTNVGYGKPRCSDIQSHRRQQRAAISAKG